MRRQIRRRNTSRVAAAFATAIALSVLLQGSAGAAHGFVGPKLPLNDLEAMFALPPTQLAQEKTPVVLGTPALTSVPAAACDSSSHPLAGVQGRVTQADINTAQAAKGWTCNTSEVGHLSTPGGFRVWRYTDAAGHTCAYYDTSFTAPLSIVSVAGGPHSEWPWST